MEGMHRTPHHVLHGLSVFFFAHDGESIKQKFPKDEKTGDYTDDVKKNEIAFISSYSKKEGKMLFGAYVDGQLVGTADVTRSKIHGIISADFGIAIKKKYWHNGIGHMLMERCIAFAKAYGYEQITLHDEACNTCARALYEEYGFIITGYEPHTAVKNGYVISFYEMILCFRENVRKYTPETGPFGSI